MTSWLPRLAVAGAFAAVCVSPALADGRSVGQTIVYTFVETNHITIPPAPAYLPPSARALYEANAKNADKPVPYTLTLMLDNVAAGGTAHANATLLNPALSALPLRARNASGADFQATLGEDGQIRPSYDPAVKPAAGAGGRLIMTSEVTQNTNAGSAMGHFTYFNAFALGCAKHGPTKPGDVWHVQLQEASITKTYDYSTSARGGDVSLVTMTYDVQDAHSSITVNASGHYDAVHRLVADLHVETKGTMSTGPFTTVSDFKLQPPPG
jgi:hypothetical protein